MMMSGSLERQLGIVLIVVGTILAINIVLKVFDITFFPLSIFFILASIIKAPFILFFPDGNAFDWEAFGAMIGYLALFIVASLFLKRLRTSQKQEEQPVEKSTSVDT